MGDDDTGKVDLASSTDDRGWDKAQSIITPYLMERVPEFRKLSDLRHQGWSNPEGDKFFQKQRKNADQSNTKTADYFYTLMKKIGSELQSATNAFNIATFQGQPEILDMCMAPGGFLATALRFNPEARSLGFSLPPSDGGHEVLLPSHPNVELKFLDITMLAADMGALEIPQDHIDAGKFFPRQFDPCRLFDLVLCDGQVLRTHAATRASYREKREARRLTNVQLALGLEHIKPGGTMVVLLHKLEAWDTVCLIHIFTKFSSVKLFEPKAGHAKRSSFYLVASKVQSQHPEAVVAIERWKTIWRFATFSKDEDYWKELRKGELSAEEMLEEFGPELIRLGREVWNVQARALERAPFIRNQPGLP